MSIYTSVNNRIRKHIIDLLIQSKSARFSDLRPARVDTNLFTYHLKELMKAGMVQKGASGQYALGPMGVSYAAALHRQSASLDPRWPHIVIMFVVQNSNGDILLQKVPTQPHIDTWSLPLGEVVGAALSLHDRARQSAEEVLGLANQELEHAGEAYIRVVHEGELLTSTLAHVYRVYSDDVVTNDTLQWARPHKLHHYALAPAVEDIMARTFFKDPFFFEEFTVDWYSNTHEF